MPETTPGGESVPPTGAQGSPASWPATLLHYQVLGRLGAGGMGEVLRARDTRLGREVAVKILPPEVAGDAERVRRFEREARAVSALNHPHIVSVFDTGSVGDVRFIVMELVEGRTLDRWLALEQPSLGALLEVLTQVADALCAAHDAGIVHRDVKPANILVTAQGYAKVLDFGLAKLESGLGGNVETRSLSHSGIVMGTLGYMAPEQALGRPADGRSDVFALGAVLYEAVAGRPAFSGATPVDVLHALVRSAPAPVREANPRAPAGLQWVLDKALAKEPRERQQSMHELASDLRRLRRSLDSAPPVAPVPARSRAWSAASVALGVASVGLAGLALGAWLWRVPATSPPRAEAFLPRRLLTLSRAAEGTLSPAISPDGQWVAYVGVNGGRSDVFVQFVSGGPATNLTHASAVPVQNRSVVGTLAVTPDGSAILFGSQSRARPGGLVSGLWLLPAPLGGPPRRLVENMGAARWSPDGRRMAAVRANPLLGDSIVAADADGGNARVLVPPGDGLHLHQPAWSADGTAVYFTRGPEAANGAPTEIWRVPATGGTPQPVVRTSGVALYPQPTPDGLALVYAGEREGEGLNIWWQKLDGSSERRLTFGAGEYTEPSLSRDGSRLACLARRRRAELGLVAADAPADNAEAAVLGEVASGDSEPSWAPGGQRILVSSMRGGRRSVWSLDSLGGDPRPLTSGEASDQGAVASPDGRNVAFVSQRGGRRGIWTVPADGGAPSLVVEAQVLDRVSWSPDGSRLVYAAAEHGEPGLWIVAAAGGAPAQLPGARGRVPAWMPAGDRIAYAAVEEGKNVVRFVEAGGALARDQLEIVPVALPTALAWSPDGTRLALVNLPGRAEAELWVLEVGSGKLRRVLRRPAPAVIEGVTWSPDGRRLLFGQTTFESQVLLLDGR